MQNNLPYFAVTLAVLQGLASAEPSANEPVTRLPEVTVIAEKVPDTVQAVPLSITAVTQQTLADDDVRTVKDAAIFAPNVFMNEFTARKLSNPYFRGIGSSPNNPGVTTYIDGVPQLNANSSSIELLDVDQVEFVRGSQGTLYGRDTVGGLINVTSRQPSLTAWHTAAEGSLGNYNLRDARVTTGGPLVPNELGLGLAGGLVDRDGYTTNDFTGHRLDNREDYFGKGQLLWKPSADWEVRLSLSGEHDHDGDYALGDLAAIRANPHQVSHDFEGYTHRDIVAPTLRLDHKGKLVDFTMITGLVHWQTEDLTDLDYTSDPALYSTRLNSEQETQFTEELRFASAKDAPLVLGDNLKLKWQTGLFVFSQDYRQDAFNDLSSLFAVGMPGFRMNQQQNADLQDLGVGLNGQTTLTAWNKLDFTLGVRVDWERKEADLQSAATVFLPPAFGGGVFPSALAAHKNYSEVSPHFGLDYHLTHDASAYASVTRGYKAGGFNSSAPPGGDEYGTEHTWDYELGVKTSWFDNRLLANLALFYIDWQDIQVNRPVPLSPQFYIANDGQAASKGVELELTARPLASLDLFGGFGLTDARFGSGSFDGGVDVSDNRLQYAPEFTANAGLQYSYALCQAATAYARAEVVGYGNYEYNSQNTASQGAYALANFRLGVRGSRWFAEGWIKNAFDRNYIPIAFAYNSASGMIGENGAPMTCGIRAGVNF